MRFVSVPLILMVQALALALVWDMGYSLFSFESFVSAVVAIVIGLVLGLVSIGAPRFRVVLLVFVFLLMVDAFFLDVAWIAMAVLFVGLSLALIFYEKLPVAVLVTSGLAFALIILVQMPRSRGKEVLLPVAAGGENAFVVHILFDEMGGLDVIPEAYRRQQDVVEITEEYMARGFTVYKDVMSVAPDTHKSMSVLLDNAFIERSDRNFEKVGDEDRYRIVNNAVHQRIERRGWPVAIMQSWYLDYCRPEFSCVTYSLEEAAGIFEQLPGRQARLQVLWREFMTALISERRGVVFMDFARPAIFEYLTLHENWRNPALPFVAMQQLDQLQDGLVQGGGRHYVFAHILLPHFPWVFDGYCKIKDISDWRLPYAARQSAAWSQARMDAYVAYQDQAMCMHRKVLALIDAVDKAHPGKVQFVIHGDHGPRIMQRKIPGKGLESLDQQTQRNLLSAFVAVRLDDGMAGYTVSANAPLQVLIPEVLLRAARDLDKQDKKSRSRFGSERER